MPQQQQPVLQPTTPQVDSPRQVRQQQQNQQFQQRQNQSQQQSTQSPRHKNVNSNRAGSSNRVPFKQKKLKVHFASVLSRTRSVESNGGRASSSQQQPITRSQSAPIQTAYIVDEAPRVQNVRPVNVAAVQEHIPIGIVPNLQQPQLVPPLNFAPQPIGHMAPPQQIPNVAIQTPQQPQLAVPQHHVPQPNQYIAHQHVTGQHVTPQVAPQQAAPQNFVPRFVDPRPNMNRPVMQQPDEFHFPQLQPQNPLNPAGIPSQQFGGMQQLQNQQIHHQPLQQAAQIQAARQPFTNIYAIRDAKNRNNARPEQRRFFNHRRGGSESDTNHGSRFFRRRFKQASSDAEG